MNDIEKDAWALKAWASQGHALNFQTAEFNEIPAPEAVRLFRIDIDEKVALNILRECKINVVAIAPGLTEILIGLEKAPSRIQLSHLPNRTFSGFAISYHSMKKPRVTLPAIPAAASAATALYAGKYYPCGSSISAADRVATGTMGCLVEKDGQIYGLTNNHVTGNYAQTAPGMPILAPGLLDAQPGNLDPFTIGHHSHCAPWTPGTPENVPIKNNLDLALFRIADSGLVTSFQGDHFDTPMRIAPAAEVIKARGTKVFKVGRSTGFTSGNLWGQATGTVEIFMSDKDFKSPVHFDNTLIVRDDHTGQFARTGDSGSLVVWRKNGEYEAVGILFCVYIPESTSYLMPMEEVVKHLQVSLIGNHNVQGNSGSGSRPSQSGIWP
jgi:hypothetical protein